MLPAFRKHIRTIIGILVFVHLLFYNSRAVMGTVSSTDITGSFTASHQGLQSENPEYSKRLANIKFPNEHRKYGLNETNSALTSFKETRIIFNTEKSSFKKNNQKKISSSCFSLSLLRAPPIA